MYWNEKLLFYIVIIFHNVTMFCCMFDQMQYKRFEKKQRYLMCHKNYIFSKYLLLEKHKLSHKSQNWVIYPIMQNMLIVNPIMVVAVNMFIFF